MFPVQLGSPLGDPECYMSSSFGPRFGTFHQGIDLSSEVRVAPAGGSPERKLCLCAA